MNTVCVGDYIINSPPLPTMILHPISKVAAYSEDTVRSSLLFVPGERYA